MRPVNLSLGLSVSILSLSNQTPHPLVSYPVPFEMMNCAPAAAGHVGVNQNPFESRVIYWFLKGASVFFNIMCLRSIPLFSFLLFGFAFPKIAPQ